MIILDKVEYDIFNHVYSFEGIEYTSVTKLKSSFMKGFDKDSVATIVAAKEGISKEDVIKRWENERLNGVSTHTELFLACNLLNQFCKDFDDYNRAIDNFRAMLSEYYSKTTFVYKIYAMFIEFVELLITRYGEQIRLHPEVILASHFYRVAGTADLIVEVPNNIALSNSKLIVFDYKTDKSITNEQTKESMKHPFNHLPDNKLNGYKIQLSMYKRLLELNKNIVEDVVNLVHIKEKEGGFTYNVMDIKAYRSDAIDEAFEMNRSKLDKDFIKL